ncbi:MAG: 2-nitropropane dioxygenase [Bdellovibrio sp.]|nr:MAG: 2-nitropropane dioxygenase [Bdellovibrio sp.]
MEHPLLIQGGMGIGVSNWRLARVVSQLGHLGVVSGTAINSVLARRLQDGDVGGHVRRALKAFPAPAIAEKILAKYFLEEGRPATQPYKGVPMFSLRPSLDLLQLTVVASFVEVFLAREDHQGLVGLNLLEKIQLPNLACLYGAILAGVHYVIMGAGIPREIPGALDLLSQNKKAELRITVDGGEPAIMEFDPAVVMDGQARTSLRRPFFLPIVSSSTLAMTLKKKATGAVNGFVVEHHVAGGHNAPPRGPLRLNGLGEPVYGQRDEVAFAEMVALDLPFWFAGQAATPEKFHEIRQAGAQGIQVGTLFAFCDESGLDPALREKTLRAIATQKPPEGGWVYTDARSSPTGFPFKVVRMSGTASESEVFEGRRRCCDLGYLRTCYKKEDGSIGERCPAEPVADYLRKGGAVEDTVGRKCLCNFLMTDIGLGQVRSGGVEPPLLTAGDDLNFVSRMLSDGRTSYSAKDVVDYLFSPVVENWVIHPALA